MDPQEIRILLVEDNPDDIAFTRRVLKFSKLDNGLAIARDGKEAIDALEEMVLVEKLPDLMLLDINLPVISGLDLLTRIKQDPRFKEMHVVMLTGSNVGVDIQKSYDLGASTYLVKPISHDALMLVVNNLFS